MGADSRGYFPVETFSDPSGLRRSATPPSPPRRMLHEADPVVGVVEDHVEGLEDAAAHGAGGPGVGEGAALVLAEDHARTVERPAADPQAVEAAAAGAHLAADAGEPPERRRVGVEEAERA